MANLSEAMKDAMTRHAEYMCKACGGPIPSYVGRYPNACPYCGNVLIRKSKARLEMILQGESIRTTLTS